jgi:cytochrome oxidase assembly protein ShyY1
MVGPYAGGVAARVTEKLAPRFWGAHLLAAVLVAIAVGLGLWQYGAWQAHRDAQAADLTDATPVPLTDVMGPDDPFPGTKVGQPVTVAGTWVPGGTVYVSGRERDGQDGYWVVTPVAVGGPGDAALPVVRGWVAHPGDAPAPPTGTTELTAWLQPPEGTGQPDDDPTDDVLPQLRIADVIQHVDQDLYGAYGVAEQPEPGLERADLAQLPDVGALTSIRNLLYAIEWWFFGAFAAFIWWRWLTEVPEPEPEEQPEDTPVG